MNKYVLDVEGDGDAPSIQFNPEDDGITHINIWFQGKTELGRMLSHFYELPFTHPFFGDFKTMEGLWRYIQNKDTTPEEAERGIEKETGPPGSEDKGKIASFLYEIIDISSRYSYEC